MPKTKGTPTVFLVVDTTFNGHVIILSVMPKPLKRLVASLNFGMTFMKVVPKLLEHNCVFVF